jgi:hypothetical protein
MKKILSITLIIAGLTLLVGCNKFLDIYPHDRFIEQQVLASEQTINATLNGIYMGMSNGSIYGATLNMTVMDCLAQLYDLSNIDHNYYEYGIYAYEQDKVKDMFESIWTSLYRQILYTNVFMDLLNRTSVSILHKDILMGEAYALRAFFHFDLLRMFGPVHATNPNDTCIPYQASAAGQASAMLPANQIIERVLADLDSAALLLQNDPIRRMGVDTTNLSDPIENFYINRNYRMNYFAVRALQARVNLWKGTDQSKAIALTAAKEVIEATAGGRSVFPWVDHRALTGANNIAQNRDRVFSSEIIFGIQNRTMYTIFDRFFSADLSVTSILCPNERRLEDVYEGQVQEYRFQYLWLFGSQGLRTFHKYARPSNIPTARFAYLQSMIRISEMYYIAAECEPNPVDGLNYLNQAREARNLSVHIENTALLQDEIRKEYLKEFYGEGQMFFYYKRKNMSAIPNGNSNTGTVTMTQERYRLPIPLSEQQAR